MKKWNATFGVYLSEQLQPTLGCTVVLKPLTTPDAAYTVVANNGTDFLLVNAGLMHCVQLESGITPIASLVNIVGGVEVDVAGACMFALANRTNVTSLRDIVNMKISLGAFSDLSIFEIQSIAHRHAGVSILGQALQLALHAPRLLKKTKAIPVLWTDDLANLPALTFEYNVQLQFNLNSQQGLYDLIDGSVDVAVGKSDITADMVSSGQISSMDIFKCLTVDPGSSGKIPGYPFPMTTAAHSEKALASHANTNQTVRKAVAEALYRITRDSDPAKAGGYSTWVPPYSYAPMAQLEESVGYIANGQCLRDATLQQLLVCPPGEESLPYDALADHCQVLGIQCPQVRASLTVLRPIGLFAFSKRCTHCVTHLEDNTRFQTALYAARVEPYYLKPWRLLHNQQLALVASEKRDEWGASVPRLLVTPIHLACQ
ncbi:hypothetical protein ABBQ32_011476 [Trebouxia sp. C0010 RCD-2024]